MSHPDGASTKKCYRYFSAYAALPGDTYSPCLRLIRDAAPIRDERAGLVTMFLIGSVTMLVP